MSATKLRYQGHCQVCGNLQDLPNELIASHSYSIKLPMFTGTCRGSGELPYELSCNLMKETIASIEEEITELAKTKNKLLLPATTPHAWYYTYLWDHCSKEKRYKWKEVEIILDKERKHPDGTTSKEFSAIYKDEYNNVKQKIEINKHDVLAVATELNFWYVNTVISSDLNQKQAYLQWLKKQVDSWKPTNLKQVEQLRY